MGAFVGAVEQPGSCVACSGFQPNDPKGSGSILFLQDKSLWPYSVQILNDSFISPSEPHRAPLASMEHVFLLSK